MRKLTLRRDVLTDLTGEELGGVVGGTTASLTRPCEPVSLPLSCQICPPTFRQSCIC